MNQQHPTPEQQAEIEQSQTRILGRREFMTMLIGGGASFALAAALGQPLDNYITPAIQRLMNGPVDPQAESPYRWGMVIDLSKCVGCDYCVYACQATNDVPDDMRWNIRVDDVTPTGNVYHVTRPCLHCNNAPCVSVCPVGATYNRPDGLVVMDYDICIGCRYCQTACPYGARQFNWEARLDETEQVATVPEFGRPEVPRRPRGVVEKCTFCIHRIDAGLENGLTPGVDPAATPACVNICPTTARYFGNLKDPDSQVSQIIRDNPTLRLREDLGTDPNVYYIPAEGMVI
ncbi:MAG: sulfate reduction electron transfer complex DsrMKJOP subunit DsrO [Chloroflexota bacterium]